MTLLTGSSRRFAATDLSQVGEIRRQASALASQARFTEEEAGAVAVVVTELATNVVRHGGGGELFLRTGEALEEGDFPELEILAVDAGKGMEDVGRSLQDGYSTGGTSGTGLGAVRRMSDRFDLYSLPGKGTIVLARFGKRWTESGPAGECTLGVVSVPVRGERECGDQWALIRRDGRALLTVIDGLGHGERAAHAAREGVRLFDQHAERAPAAILQLMHAGMRSTRGAAVAIAELNSARSALIYAGVGNIAGVLRSRDSSRSLASYNGIVGHELRRLQEFTNPLEKGSLLVMHSDGVSARWNLDAYPGLFLRDPAIVAGTLYRDFRRERDDVTVAVVRC